MDWSSQSSSYSPGEEPSSSQRPGGSKRRSITEMSQSARMTPQSQRERGLGLPWMESHGLCAVDVLAGDIDEARQFCLIPTPELAEKTKVVPRSPDLQSPSSMQRRFVDLVRRASLSELSPASDRSQSGVPGTPDTMSRRRSSLASLFESTPDTKSPVPTVLDSSPMSGTTPIYESGILSGQGPACSSAAPLRVPLICRLDRRLAQTSNTSVVERISTSAGPAITKKVQSGSFMGNLPHKLVDQCPIFEDAAAPRKTSDGDKCNRSNRALEQPLTSARNKRKHVSEETLFVSEMQASQGTKENETNLGTSSRRSVHKKQAIARGNANLKALAKQAELQAAEKASVASVAAKLGSRVVAPR